MIVSSMEKASANMATQQAQISICDVSMVYRGRTGLINKLTRRTSKDYVALANRPVGK